MTTTTLPTAVDPAELERKITDMYTRVALDPHGRFHFETGRALAERLGYTDAELDAAPAEAVESFAGVGYYFDMADLRPGDHVVDLGSGSGTDSFIAARKVTPGGQVTGIEMTEAQLAKARGLALGPAFADVQFHQAFIDATGLPGGRYDAVMSNGVINLSLDKAAVFREAARLLKSGGRLAIADIVSDVHLPESITCNASVWASCIGGAMQRDLLVETIEQAGFIVMAMKANHEYRFLSKSAQGAMRDYGVRSLSLLAIRN